MKTVIKKWLQKAAVVTSVLGLFLTNILTAQAFEIIQLMEITAYVNVNITSSSISDTTFDPENDGNVIISYCTDALADVKVGIYKLENNNVKKVATLQEYTEVATGCYSKTWDGEYGQNNEVGTQGQVVANGQYYYGVNAKNPANEDYKAQWFEVGDFANKTPDDGDDSDKDDSDDETKLKIVDIEVSEPVFDPWDEQETEITFTINKDAYVTLTVFDDDDEEIDVVVDEKLYKKGENEIDWDGRDTFGKVVKQGDYYYELVAESGSDSDRETGSLEIEKGYDQKKTSTKDARIKRAYVTKENFDPGRHEKTYIVFNLTAKADLKVAIYDEDGDEVEELVDDDDASAGFYAIKWDGEVVLNEEGKYTYKIYAENSKGEDEINGEIKIEEDGKSNNKPNIFNDNIKPEDLPYFPNKNQLEIKFKLEKDAEITLEIRDESDVVATIADEVELGSGSYSLKWDGKDEYGDIVTDGIYSYKLIAANYKGKDVEKGNFSIEDASEARKTRNCGGFTDVNKESQYCKAIEWAYDNDIFVGYNNGSFQPNKPINRVEALKVTLEALEVKILSSNGQKYGFKDVNPYDWYMDYIKTALSLGIVAGYPDNTFKPDRPVLRVEALVMVLNTGKVKGDLIVPSNTYGQPYYDTPNAPITKWYLPYAWMAKELQLTEDAYYFYPEEPMTRAKMADMLYRYNLAIK